MRGVEATSATVIGVGSKVPSVATVTAVVAVVNPGASTCTVHAPGSSRGKMNSVEGAMGRSASAGGASERVAVTRAVAGSKGGPLVTVTDTMPVTWPFRYFTTSSSALTISFQACAV